MELDFTTYRSTNDIFESLESLIGRKNRNFHGPFVVNGYCMFSCRHCGGWWYELKSPGCTNNGRTKG